MVSGKWEISMFGGSFGTWKVQLGDHQIEHKPASGSVEELPVCRAQVLGLYIAVTSIHEIQASVTMILQQLEYLMILEKFSS